jgi:hydroxylamine reductase (hybrid-cluster protein)
MADGYSKLLTYIVEHEITRNESRESEIEATATRDVDAEIAGVVRDLREDADRLAPYFAEGLRRALTGNGRVVVDDTDEQGNGIADAFARFLVRANLATSESSEIGEEHYRYKFDVDLAKLREIANKAGVDLATT